MPNPLRLALPALLLAAAPALAQDTAAESDAERTIPSLIAQVAGPDGADLGSVTAAFAPSGVTLLTLTLTGLAPGIHGIHIHEVGACEGPTFESAGGHLAGDREHGIMVEGGPHPGDLPNIHVLDSGAITLELFAHDLTEDMLTQGDGTAFIVHSAPDDYRGQPSGNAGDRVACGVFQPAE